MSFKKRLEELKQEALKEGLCVTIITEECRKPKPDVVPVPEGVKFVGNYSFPGLVIGKSKNGRYYLILRWSNPDEWIKDLIEVDCAEIPMLIEATPVKFDELEVGEWFLWDFDSAKTRYVYCLKASPAVALHANDGGWLRDFEPSGSAEFNRVRPA